MQMFQNLQIRIKMKKIPKYIVLFSAASLLLVSCKVTDTYQKPEIPQEKLEKLYGDIQVEDSLSIAKIPYTQIFKDAKLQNLIAQTLENNYDLQTAVLRIKQNDAYFKQSKLAYFPGLNIGPSVSGGKTSAAAQPGVASRETQNFQLSVTTGWEFNIWGKLGAAKHAAYATLLASDAAKRAIQTQLVAQTATLYYRLLALDQQLDILKKTIEVRKERIETIKALKVAGVTNGADVAQSEAALYSTQVTLPQLQQSIKEVENALCLLMGTPPHHIERGSIRTQQLALELKTGVPSEILRNRPDVQQAEYLFQKAFETRNVAKADMYPSFNISATLGLSSFKLKDLFDNSLMYNASGALTEVIFAHGSKKAQLKIATLQQQEAYLNFEKAVLTAGSEVANAMNAYESSLEKREYRQLQIQSLQQAADFTLELLKYSDNTNYTDVLTTTESLLNAKLSAVDDQLQLLLAGVEFYRAIGGGQY